METGRIPRRKMPLWKKELLFFLAAIAVAALLFAVVAASLFLLPEEDVPRVFVYARGYFDYFLRDPLASQALWNALGVLLAGALGAAVVFRAAAAVLTWRFPALPAGWIDLAAVALTVLLPALLMALALDIVWGALPFYSWKVAIPVRWLVAVSFSALPALLLAFLMWGLEQPLRAKRRRAAQGNPQSIYRVYKEAVMDKIYIRGLRVFAYHGVNPEEKEKGQPFELDVTLAVDLSRPGRTDDLNDTVNYSKVAKCVLRTMQAGKDDLIERAAERVAQAVLGEFPLVQAVTVLLKKPRAPIAADFGYVAVEITRSRGDRS